MQEHPDPPVTTDTNSQLVLQGPLTNTNTLATNRELVKLTKGERQALAHQREVARVAKEQAKMALMDTIYDLIYQWADAHNIPKERARSEILLNSARKATKKERTAMARNGMIAEMAPILNNGVFCAG